MQLNVYSFASVQSVLVFFDVDYGVIIFPSQFMVTDRFHIFKQILHELVPVIFVPCTFVDRSADLVCSIDESQLVLNLHHIGEFPQRSIKNLRLPVLNSERQLQTVPPCLRKLVLRESGLPSIPLNFLHICDMFGPDCRL